MFIIIDAVIGLAVFVVAIKYFYSKRGLTLIGLLCGSFVALLVSSYLGMAIIHIISQAIIIVSLIGIGTYLFFDKNLDASDKKMNPATIVVASLFFVIIAFAAQLAIGNKVAEFPTQIKLTAVNLKDGTAATFGDLNKVKITISAPRSSWQSISESNFSAVIDIGNSDQGVYDLPINVTSKNDKIKVVRVSPDRATISVEPIIKKTVQVAVKYTGKAGNDLVPDDPKITPDKVEISAAKSVATGITSAIAKVTLNGDTATLKVDSELAVYNSNDETIAGVTINPATVNLEIGFVKPGKNKTVGITPVISGTPASGYWVKSAVADPLTATISGQIDTLQATSFISTKAVDVGGLTANKTFTTQLILPTGIVLVNNIADVKVTVEIASTNTIKQVSPEISYPGLSSSLQVKSISPTSVSTSVTGSSNTLDVMKDSDVKLQIDLSAYKSAGTYSITITNANFTLPSGIGLQSFLPSAITVVLENK